MIISQLYQKRPNTQAVLWQVFGTAITLKVLETCTPYLKRPFLAHRFWQGVSGIKPV
jgi:hypothetical protein